MYYGIRNRSLKLQPRGTFTQCFVPQAPCEQHVSQWIFFLYSADVSSQRKLTHVTVVLPQFIQKCHLSLR